MIRFEFENEKDFLRFVNIASAPRLHWGYCCEQCERHTLTRAADGRRLCAECEIREYLAEVEGAESA